MESNKSKTGNSKNDTLNAVTTSVETQENNTESTDVTPTSHNHNESLTSKEAKNKFLQYEEQLKTLKNEKSLLINKIELNSSKSSSAINKQYTIKHLNDLLNEVIQTMNNMREVISSVTQNSLQFPKNKVLDTHNNQEDHEETQNYGNMIKNNSEKSLQKESLSTNNNKVSNSSFEFNDNKDLIPQVRTLLSIALKIININFLQTKNKYIFKNDYIL